MPSPQHRCLGDNRETVERQGDLGTGANQGSVRLSAATIKVTPSSDTVVE